MHPLFAHVRGLALYALAWLLAGVAGAEIVRLVAPQPFGGALAFAAPLALVFGFIVLSAWWVCRANPLAPGRLGRAATVQAGAAVQAAASWAVAGLLWALLLARRAPGWTARPLILREALLLLAAGVPIYLGSAVVHYLVQAFEASRRAERRLLQSEVAAREAELRALRAQLHPHFLFNSLNSINALVGSDPEAARRMCEGLGDFLRRTLALGARDHVALSEELELVECYLAIEQVRFGDRLQVERCIEDGAGACRVPPLLLQPLVENAIKHGVAGRIEGGTVSLRARRNGDVLVLEVENPVDESAVARPGAGLGLENVRRRLDGFGPRAARLDAERGPEYFRVTLTLPALGAGA
ncbi:MAG TPA: histidine kinase [Candidatus Acidoferrales bacterium]|nr:histidine kinase [Candidatus Acidoferrales bacterium]